MKQFLQKGKPKARQGSVLFTVVTVMMVMVVFLMTTLILTSSSHKRTYYNFYEKQAQYAAQAALDSITNSAYTDDGFRTWMEDASNWAGGASRTIDVTFQNSNINFTNKAGNSSVVSCTIQKIDNSYIWDAESNKMYEQPTWRLTATASVGQGRNVAECSVSNYLYQNPSGYTLGDPTKNKVDATFADAPQETGTPGTSGDPVFPGQAMYNLGGGGFNSGNQYCMGPIYSNMGKTPEPASFMNYSTADSASGSNNTQYVGGGILNQTFVMESEKVYEFQQAGEGLVIYGNYRQKNNTVNFISNLNANYKPSNYRDLNYVYIDGSLDIDQGNTILFGHTGNAANIYPMRLFVGEATIPKGNGTHIYGDMILLSPYGKSELGGNGNTKLYTFVTQNIEKTGYGTDYTTGNLICNNNTLDLCTSGALYIGGDLIMSNPSGTLTIGNNSGTDRKLTVGGAIVCAGTLVIGSDANIECSTIIAKNVIGLNGATTYGNNQNGPLISNLMVEKNGLTDTGKTWTVSELGISYEGVTSTNYQAAVDAILSSDTKGYSGYVGYTGTLTGDNGGSFTDCSLYPMFPFYARQDEIFEEYVRWDLRSTSPLDINTVIKNDKLIQESYAAGHTWEIKAFNNVSNGAGTAKTIYAPVTHPKSRNLGTKYKGDYACIEATPFGDQLNSNQYADTLTDLIGAGNTLPAHTTVRTLTDKIKIAGHDTAGALQVSTVEGKISVIEKSCSIDLSQVTDNNGETIFFFNQTDTSKPIYVEIKGHTGTDRQLYFITNNTVKYTAAGTGTNYNPASITEADMYCAPNSTSYAGRSEVIFFFEDATYVSKLNLVSTGAYYQYMTNKAFVAVSNPLYPGTAEWKALAANSPKRYSFELMPNAVVYGAAGGTVDAQNACFMNAAVIMPHTSLALKESPQVRCYYQEYVDSNVHDTVQQPKVVCLGSMVVENFDMFGNQLISIYLGDELRGPRPPSYKFDPGNVNNNSVGSEKSKNDLGNFSNSHQGAG